MTTPIKLGRKVRIPANKLCHVLWFDTRKEVTCQVTDYPVQAVTRAKLLRLDRSASNVRIQYRGAEYEVDCVKVLR